MTPEITRFNPRLHDLAAFSCEVAEVDSFFNSRPNEHNFRFVWEQRVGDIFVALESGDLVGVIAYAAGHVPPEIAGVVASDLRNSGRKGRQKPREMGKIPAVRIIILAVSRPRQKQGIGTALLNHALSAITAPVYYLIPQRGSERFYENSGFVRKSAGVREIMVRIPPALKLFGG